MESGPESAAPRGLLNETDGRELCRIARVTLTEYLTCGRIPPGRPHRAALVASAAVFVTLRRRGELRGCIGTVDDSTPIYQAVQEMTVAAATRDPRFPAVSEAELSDVDLEVSVLGPRERFRDPSELEVGRHGVAISAFGRRGLLLPKVALEAGWDAGTLLLAVCRKAGLPDDAWREPTAVLERFVAQVFEERPELA